MEKNYNTTAQVPVKEKKCPYRTINMNTYTHDIMPEEMASFRSGGRVQSGYKNLDAVTNMYPGLYVLGAISSLGKTTFSHQMCDQMAEAGHHVLFFSLEQNALELASKSLSRIMAKKDATKAMTSLEIRKSENDERVKAAVDEYSGFTDNVTVIECSFSMTMDDIVQCVKEYIERNKVTPIVIVDYLQVIQAPENSRMTTKDLVDSHVRRLKKLQSENKLVLIAISSLNRQNYMTQIDYESFKESGGIEYTADVVWGLQLQVLSTDEIFDKQGSINEKREVIKKAKAANPRKVELVCLKNRFGISSYTCAFDYYPQFDLFIPDMTGVKTDENADPDGFMQLPAGMEDDCPFKH